MCDFRVDPAFKQLPLTAVIVVSGRESEWLWELKVTQSGGSLKGSMAFEQYQ